jgi:hypothetical protein
VVIENANFFCRAAGIPLTNPVHGGKRIIEFKRRGFRRSTMPPFWQPGRTTARYDELGKVM